MAATRPQSGFTLVELIISMVAIGIAVAGVLAVMSRTVLSSSDPMLTQQAVAIGEAYLEEILTKDYTDPGGPAETRATYDDVDDYNVLDGAPESPPRNQKGDAIAELANYTVRVQVGGPVVVAGGATMKPITVTVTHTSGITVALSGYRANYP